MDEEGGREGPLRILAIDGGGIGSLASSIWLTGLEEEMLGCGKGRLYERFDLIAGTSTGSILACAISLGIKAHCLVEFFQEERRQLFPGAIARFVERFGRSSSDSKPKYSCKPLESCLKNLLHTYKVGDSRTRLMVFAYDVMHHKPVVYKSWNPDCGTIPMWFACKASVSTPGYFPATILPDNMLVDGCLVASNPSLHALAEAMDIEASCHGRNLLLNDVLVVSVGCGRICQPIERQSRHWGFNDWSERILEFSFCASCDETDYISQKLIGENFHRFQCDFPSEVGSIDDASDDSIEAIEQAADNLMKSKQYHASIDKIISLL